MNDITAQYHDRGYVVVPSVFTATEVQALRQALVGISDAAPAWRGPWMAPDEPATLQTRHNVHLHPPWDVAVTSPALLRPIEAIMGTPPIFAGSTLIAKPARTGQAFPLHQDAAYYGADDPGYVIATVYIDEATADNGPLCVLPGSHRQGLVPHITTGAAGRKYLPLEQYRLEDAEAVLGQVGDVVLMSLCAVHGSEPNRADRVRRTVRLGYRSRPA